MIEMNHKKMILIADYKEDLRKWSQSSLQMDFCPVRPVMMRIMRLPPQHSESKFLPFLNPTFFIEVFKSILIDENFCNIVYY